jgi:hypothetical protein
VRDLAEIVSIYEAIDAMLEQQRDGALAENDRARADRIERRQLINDHAYLVLCWGQLEVAVNDRCKELISRRRAETSWDRRRAWDLHDPDRLSLAFEDRVALLADRDAGRGGTFNRIMRWYQYRNDAAHGRFRGERIEVPFVAAELRTLAGLLAP